MVAMICTWNKCLKRNFTLKQFNVVKMQPKIICFAKIFFSQKMLCLNKNGPQTLHYLYSSLILHPYPWCKFSYFSTALGLNLSFSNAENQCIRHLTRGQCRVPWMIQVDIETYCATTRGDRYFKEFKQMFMKFTKGAMQGTLDDIGRHIDSIL